MDSEQRGDRILFAHSFGPDTAAWEPLGVHLGEVGQFARGFGAPFGAAELAYVAALLHDIGKASPDYQRYIRGEGPSPDHSTAGAVEAVRRYARQAPLARLIAFAVAGHHSGLADGTGEGGAVRSLTARLADADRLPDYSGWGEHAGPLPDTLPPPGWTRARDPAFSLAFLGRMIFSCLVDADSLATEAFYAERAGEAIERGGHAPLSELRARLDRHMAGFAGRSGELNVLRAEILAHARAKACAAPGLFSMTVPTGGGKTLASLAFALDHAIAHGLDRVIYVIPYTSIIEQTAQAFRNALGDADVLEHHGNFDWERAPKGTTPAADDEGRDGLEKLRRAAENWDAPVIVTTAVQFFESLHGARRGRCRKLHRIARSVVILDEAQTLPVHLLRPCMAAMQELADNYRTSLVLCTATQPALSRRDGFAAGLDIAEDRELAPEPARLYRSLKRVTVEHAGPTEDEAIAARFAEQPRMLVIVNSRAHAQALFALIRTMPGARHLTTLMCPAHRRKVLAEIRAELAAGRPVRLVATSLIEAGVDVDFPEVWRAETGLDSVAQAAGRCNREGRLASGRVVVFEAAGRRVLEMVKQPAAAFRSALRGHEDDPLGLDAVRAYFRELYWAKGDQALDAATLEGKPFPILKRIAERFDRAHPNDPPHFPYASIAAAFRMIDDAMEPVIVRWRGGEDSDEPNRLIAQLRVADRPSARMLRRLQHYTVTVPPGPFAQMLATGAIQPISAEKYGSRFVSLEGGTYDEATGLQLDPLAMAVETGII